MKIKRRIKHFEISLRDNYYDYSSKIRNQSWNVYAEELQDMYCTLVKD